MSVPDDLRRLAEQMEQSSTLNPRSIGHDLSLAEAVRILRQQMPSAYVSIDMELNAHAGSVPVVGWKVYTTWTNPAMTFNGSSLGAAVRQCIEHISEPAADQLEAADAILGPVLPKGAAVEDVPL